MAYTIDYSQLQPSRTLTFEQARNLAELMTVYINVNFERNGDYQAGLDDMARRIQRNGLEDSINWTFDAAAKQGAKNVDWKAVVEPYKTPEAEARALVQRLYEATKGSTTHFETYVKAAQMRTPSEMVAYWNELNKDKPTLLAKIPAEELAELDKKAAENRSQVIQKDFGNFIQSANQIYAGKDITPNYDPSMDASKVINDRLAQFGYKASQADIDRWNETARRMGTGTAIALIDRTLGLQGFDRAMATTGVGEEFRGVPLSGQLPSTYAGSSLYQPRDYSGQLISVENQATAGREITPEQVLVPLSKVPSPGTSTLAQTGSTSLAGIPISGVAQPSVGGNVPLPSVQQPVSNQGFIQSNLAPMTPVTGGGLPTPSPLPTAQGPLPALTRPQPLRGTLPASFANIQIQPPVPLQQQPMFPTPTQLLERVRQEDAARFAQPEPQPEQSTDAFIRNNEMRPPGFLNFAKGGEVSDDEFIQEVMTGTRPEDFPETSPVDTAVSDFISSRSKLVTDPKEFFRVMGENIKQQYGDINNDPKAMEAFLVDNLGFGGLTAYHASGKMFKQLDPSKAKSGVGEQRYGTGAGYTAESRPVAESFMGAEAQALRASGALDPKLEFVYDLVSQKRSDMDVLDAIAAKYGKSIGFDEAQDILKKAKSMAQGYLYKGDIPDEIIPSFLDWDKPLKQQTVEVKKLLSKDPLVKESVDPANWREVSGGIIQKGEGGLDDLTGDSIYKYISLKLGSDSAATEYLDKLGVRGIRYADPGSKGLGRAPSGTSNFVVFRPEDYRIESVNDRPIKKAQGGEVTDFIKRFSKGGAAEDQEALVERTGDVLSKAPKSQELANQIRNLFQQLETPSPSAEEDYLKSRPTPESREPIRSRKAMEAFLKAANPRLDIEERPLPGGKFGFVRADDPDTLVISTRQFPAQREETAFHELEHSLSERGGNPLGKLNEEGKPLIMDNNYRFDVLYNQDRKIGGEGRFARFDMMNRFIKNKDKLEKFFGRPFDSNYFSRDPEPGLFAEQIADLSALEQITNKSLTRDPKMRELLFPDDKAAAVYDAITGLRQTRLDAKDLPPYTPNYPEEKGIMDWIRGKLGMGEK